MSSTFNQIAPLYGNIIDEARTRLEFIERALDPEIANNMDYIAVSDLCALQFRKVFEAVALACLLAHGDIAGHRLKQDIYRADKLLGALEKLNPNFYPHPCAIHHGSGEVLFEKLPDDSWLTKAELKKHYFEFDHHMHVGSLFRRGRHPTVIEAESLRQILAKVRALVTGHYISLAGDTNRLVCEATPGEPVLLTSAEFVLIRSEPNPVIKS